jgi:hypothetical protein
MRLAVAGMDPTRARTPGPIVLRAYFKKQRGATGLFHPLRAVPDSGARSGLSWPDEEC